jgi:phosphatidylserine/phosphatidylglycerophosphate/cardiolipin synthase-like enzyme
MDPARALLIESLQAADHQKRLRFYTPITAGGEYIYVHAKITIVDDVQLRVGSANMNNRSMGLDSECDLLIDVREEVSAAAGEPIAAFRCDLLGEHLGVSAETIAAEFACSGSLIATVEALRGGGRTLRPLEVKKPSESEAELAESELLDPESAGAHIEPPARPGLSAGLGSTLRIIPGH